MPKRPSSAKRLNSSFGNSARSSHSRACGASSRSQNSRTVRRKAWWSSVNGSNPTMAPLLAQEGLLERAVGGLRPEPEPEHGVGELLALDGGAPAARRRDGGALAQHVRHEHLGPLLHVREGGGDPVERLEQRRQPGAAGVRLEAVAVGLEDGLLVHLAQ